VPYVFFVLTARLIPILTSDPPQIKFIKFFAWEDMWIGRVSEAREKEIRWMMKARTNDIIFYMLWMTAPVLVSIVSFWAFVVVAGGELNVSIAFTVSFVFWSFFFLSTPLIGTLRRLRSST